MSLINFVFLVFFIVKCAFADELPFKVNNAIQSNMVLQQQPYKTTIWGTGKINSVIFFTMDTIMLQSTVDENGQWKIVIDPQPSSKVARKMIIRNSDPSTNAFVFDNILFGDVFICSGQSNMEFVVSSAFNATEAFEEAKTSGYDIRLFTVEKNYQLNETDDFGDKIRQNWSILSPDSLGANLENEYFYFSAVCYYYGLHLYKALGIPIGLIATSWGGTSAEAWTPKEALSKCSDLFIGDSAPNKYPGSLWNGMVNPLIKMTIKGVIFYQAEQNMNHFGNYSENSGYECVFPTLISEWRKHFSTNGFTDSNFPFGFVQLAGYCGSGDHKCNPGPSVHLMRSAQTISYGYAPNPILNNTFFAVSVDLPDPVIPSSSYGDIHPRNKLDIGYRLAHSALGLIYNKHSLTITGPIVSSCELTEGILMLVIDLKSLINEEMELKDDIGFEVMDSDNTWKSVKVQYIKTNIIGIDVSGIKSPSGIRYLWKANPCCPDAYTTTTPFSCPMNQCGIYTTLSRLPMPPFNYIINNNKCVIMK